MLNRHSEAFAFSKGDLGYCTIFEHEIDTQGFYLVGAHLTDLVNMKKRKYISKSQAFVQ